MISNTKSLEEERYKFMKQIIANGMFKYIFFHIYKFIYVVIISDDINIRTEQNIIHQRRYREKKYLF